MTHKHPAQFERRPVWPATINALLAGLTAAGLTVWVSLYQASPVGWNVDYSFVTDAAWLAQLLKVGWTRSLASEPPLQHFQDPILAVRTFLLNFDRFDLIAPLARRLAVISVIASFTALVVGFYTYERLEKVDRLKHIRGRQLIKGRKAIRYARCAYRRLIRQYGRGITVAPGVAISLETETKHFLLVGASGGGKTQTLRYWIDQVLRSRDKLIIHDSKGDMTAALLVDDFILLAPHDDRSWGWDVARDCRGLAAARELAARLVPKGDDNPMWANGAREILTGLIRFLQVKHGDQWDWKTLRDTAFSSPLDILTLLTEVHSEGAKFVEMDKETGLPHKTSYSFLVTLWSGIGGIVGPLAAAWSDMPSDRKVSLTAWLRDNGTEPRTIILQRSSEFAELSEAWIGAAVQLMANDAASSSFGDFVDRRIWMFLDEFAQLGKLKGFRQFLEVGRSRGIRCALGLQDLEQLADLYGQEALKTWLNTIETKIVCRMNAGPSAKFIADDLIGQREVSWKERTTTKTSGNIFENRSSTHSVNDQIRIETIPVVFPDFLERQLGPVQTGGETKIRALYLAGGDLFQFDWPITPWPNRRAASEPAPWTVD